MMKQIKSRCRKLLLPLLGGLMLTACEKDNGEETRVSEFGPVKKEIIGPWKSGTVNIPVLSNQPYDIALINPDNGWLTLDTEGRGTHFTGDDLFKVHISTNDGFPRMEGIRLWTRDRADTVYIKQEGFISPELSFSTRSITVLGDGGQATAQLTTNLELEDLGQQIVYTSSDEGGWISDLDISNGFLILQAAPNADPEALRNARITLSYRDGWNRTTESTVYITQANAKNEFGHEISFGEVRDMVGPVNRDVFIEGRVISDIGNGNNGENSMKTMTSIDYTETYRTAYIQSLDGSQGFMIKTATEDDNIFERYSKVRILLKGATVTQEVDPERYIISNVTSAMVMSSVSGSASDIPQKRKHYSELTDMDIYTWVTLADCELPVRKGSLTPINEGYARNTGANRETKYPMLVRDKNGDSFYMLTNTTCKYRRDGQMLPYGSGDISGVLVHETHDRFVWMGSQGMGDIGRYQIRHLTREDIALEKDFANSFSALLTEYRYGKLESRVFRPTTGDNGYLTFTLPDEKSGDAGWGVSDPSYLGPIGNKDNLDKEGPTSGIHTGNINGNGVVENGKQMCTDKGTNDDGKGNVSSADFSAWTNKCQWWNTETDRSEAWLLHFSTQGISTNVLSLQVAIQNRVIGGPRYIKVDWSEHGDNNRDDWNPITEFQVPDIVNWSLTLYWQCAGYKYVNIPLPLELLGKEDVCIRFSAANQKAGGKEDDEFDNQIISTGEIAFSYIGVRYNK
ncbi:BACON domain-containing protein [Alistipes sp. kh20]|uniref:BACON domain-containing protein n=1 Tax=Alistipes montrealensis TaxID=2834113 RepID=UPI001BD18FA3|nr:BACON domain-containing protein [Alistipes montrealensis]MBS4766057.1 BACON domain-containing protein [Alistipes montrealensis]